MIFFRRKTPVDLGWLHTDMHSHLVPGIDDGSPDIASSVALIRGMSELGYKKIITTPHIYWEFYPNTPDKIGTGMEEVRKAVMAEGIEVELHAAAEYFMDDHFEQLLQAKAPLLTLSRNFLLVEYSMVTAPMDLMDILFELQMQNYQPVIAHPERYTYQGRRKESFDELKNTGCHFQLNILSLTGHYGPAVQELAEYLLKKNYYDFIGTDLHHSRHLSLIQKLSPAVMKKLRELAELKNHLL
ncbi:MAG TPA: CpsB/CapC family capsule biosynthesis tyrosine phosphatase [Flavisolibacter sp.]